MPCRGGGGEEGMGTVGFDWCIRDIKLEKWCESGTQKEMQEQGGGKESESSLALSFATDQNHAVHNISW